MYRLFLDDEFVGLYGLARYIAVVIAVAYYTYKKNLNEMLNYYHRVLYACDLSVH